MQYTNNHKFNLPETTDNVSITAINSNFEKADSLFSGDEIPLGLAYQDASSDSSLSWHTKVSSAIAILAYRIAHVLGTSVLLGSGFQEATSSAEITADTTIAEAVGQLLYRINHTSGATPLAKDILCTQLASLTSPPDEVMPTDSVLMAIEKLIAKIRFETIKSMTASLSKNGTTVTAYDQLGNETCSFTVPNSTMIVPSGTCSTAAATVAKVGTMSGFVRSTGSIVTIKFTYANTATRPTLNVNNTGAAPIYNCHTNAAIVSGNITEGMTALLMFNGTQWILLNPAIVNNSSKT